MSRIVIKQPAETLAYAVPGLADIASVEDITVIARQYRPDVRPLVAAQAVEGGKLVLTLSGGSDGELYLITVLVTLLDGTRPEAEIELQVTDLIWTMPDGGAPMLTIAEFVRKFGLEETVRMTDAGDGRIDRDLLVAALTDAQAMAEAYLADRYQLPFNIVPLLVQTCIADMARARLYTNEPPDNVATSARIALRNLEKLQTGQISLGAAALADGGGSNAPVRFTLGRASYPNRLKDY